jgi:hypothetical protein
MATTLDECLNEILKDENGDPVTPSCGIEKLLSILCDCTHSEPSSLTNSDIDEITSS